MIYPSINEIMKSKHIDSKYTLVVATAKRAREINQTKVTFTECKSDKAVTIALHEIYENKINFKSEGKEDKLSPNETIMNHILEENMVSSAEENDKTDDMTDDLEETDSDTENNE